MNKIPKWFKSLDQELLDNAKIVYITYGYGIPYFKSGVYIDAHYNLGQNLMNCSHKHKILSYNVTSKLDFAHEFTEEFIEYLFMDVDR